MSLSTYPLIMLCCAVQLPCFSKPNLFCLRGFALAVPFAWNTFFPDSHMAHSHIHSMLNSILINTSETVFCPHCPSTLLCFFIAFTLFKIMYLFAYYLSSRLKYNLHKSLVLVYLFTAAVPAPHPRLTHNMCSLNMLHEWIKNDLIIFKKLKKST